MPMNIPMPQLPLSGLNQAIATGGNLFSQMMTPAIQRENMQREWKQHVENLALQKQQEGRLSSMLPLQRKLAELNISKAEMETDPAKKMAYINAIMQGIQGMGGQPSTSANPQNPQPQGQMGQQNPFQGQGMMSPQTMDAQQQQPQMESQGTEMPGADQTQIGAPIGGSFTPQQEMAMSLAGIKLPTYKENPAAKRAADLQSKLTEAKYKHELKHAEEQEKADLKNKETRTKTIESAKNDLTHLEETLRGLQVMQKIAEDKKNKDMFGHWIEGHDTAAKRADNPNAGTWQVYGLEPIIEAEMKMSSKGNQLALKTALQNKPNFAENQDVAHQKIKGAIEKIQRRIEQTKKIAGQDQKGNEFEHMSDDELRAIAEGG